MLNSDILIKIQEAFKNKYIGDYVFSKEELTVIYNEASEIFRNSIFEWGKRIQKKDYDLIFVALINLSKEWNTEKIGLFEYLYKKLVGNDYDSDEEDEAGKSSGKFYTELTTIIKASCDLNHKYMLNSYTKKYYATLCSHSFAPISSIESLFEMCWQIYCKDLDYEYISDDLIFELIANSFHNKCLNASGDEDFQIGSKIFSLRAGIKGLAIDYIDYFAELINTIIGNINSLFTSTPIKSTNYLNILLKDWWKKQEEKFSEERKKSTSRHLNAVSDYSLIKPRYYIEEGNVNLIIPPIRFTTNLNFNPYIEVFTNGNRIICDEMITKGSGLVMTTKQLEYNIDMFNLTDIKIIISHCGEEIYNSKETLNRQFILFRDSKELLSQECLPGQYNLYIKDYDVLSQVPKNIHKNKMYLYSFVAEDNEVLQCSDRTVIFLSDNSNSDFYFFANHYQNLLFRYNEEEYKVIDGELFLIISNELNPREYGVRFGSIVFRLLDFDEERIENKRRFCLTNIINVGKGQKITVFRYSDNKTVASINLIKFNNIQVEYDKSIYYGSEGNGNVKFTTEKYDLETSFSIHQNDVIIKLSDGELVFYPPVLRWKIDDNEWNIGPINGGIWYREFTNTSKLYIESPKNMVCQLCFGNDIIQEDKYQEFLLGQFIYSYKDEHQSLDHSVLFIKSDDNNFFDCGDIYYKETFIDNPFFIFSSRNEIYWKPECYIGNKDDIFKLEILLNDKVIFNSNLNLKKEKMDFPYLEENRYTINLYLIDNSFFGENKLIYKQQFIFGNEKNINYKYKTIMIKSAKLFDKNEFVSIKPIYLNNIKYLGNPNGFDLYSASLFIIDRDGKKKYLNNMKDESGEFIRINPVRLDFLASNSLYMGYGLDLKDRDFEYDSEFTLNYKSETTIGNRCCGIKNQGIDYFNFEVKEDV